MKVFILLSISYAVLAYSECGLRQHHLSDSRYRRSIIGGNEVTTLGKWPWQILIHAGNDSAVCGGTIISPQWVLTAAHCAVTMNGLKPFVITEVTQHPNEVIRKINPNETFTTLAEAKLHPELKDHIHEAIEMKLDRPLTYSQDVATICLPTPSQYIPRGGQAVVTGFGKSNVRGTNEIVEDRQLRDTIVPIIPLDLCHERWSSPAPDVSEKAELLVAAWHERKAICAGSFGHGGFQGDSGGPLIMRATDGRWFQIGVVSFGQSERPLEADNYPNVYTDVRKYCDWIKKTTNGEASCQDEEVTLEDVKIRM